MNKNILFFDVDGTLFDCGNGMPHISTYLKEAFRQLRANGHLCFIASGRPYAYLNQEIKDLGFDGFVLCNGALVLKDGELLLTHYIPKKEVQYLVSEFEKRNCMYALVDTYQSYCPKKFTLMYDVLRKFEVPLQHVCGDFVLENVNTAKIEVFCPDEESKAFVRHLQDHGYEIIDYADSGSFEINLADVSKGKSIIELLDTLDIPIEDSLAFGDGQNDMEMLSVVGYGVAMGNAYEPLKKVANQVTETCANHGIVRELQRLGLVSKILLD